MGIFLRIAWRNVWRNKRRSLLTILAIVFAMVVTIFARGLQLGTYEQTIENAVRTHTGMIQIHGEGYYEEKKLEYGFIPGNEIKNILESCPKTITYTYRLRGVGLISVGELTRGGQVIGIVPEKENQITQMAARIKKGDFLSSGKQGYIVIGETLAKNLHAQVGDELVILTQGYHGMLGAQKFIISGIFSFGMENLDGYTVFATLQDVQELLSMPGFVTEITINAEKIADIPPIITYFRASVDKLNLSAMTWDELMPELVQMIAFDNIGGLIMIFILMMVVAFGILNTYLMMVMERIREFGVLMSLGLKPRQILILILMESFFLAVTGIVIGASLGALVNWYFVLHPIQLSQEISEVMLSYGFTPVLFVKLSFTHILNQGTGFLSLAIIMAFFPALKAYRFKPTEALRHV